MKKILIVYATAGIGHKKAALAVADALKNRNIPYEIVDVLDYTNALLKWIYQHFYITIVKNIPSFWAFIYHSLDIAWVYNTIKGLRTLTNRLNSGKFAQYLCKTQPDIVVSSHFFSSEVVSSLKRRHLINPYLITVITDFKLHKYWVSKETDLFVAADEFLGQQIKELGIGAEKIRTVGIPLESRFYETLDKELLYKKLDIKKGFFTILISSGGFGVGPVERIVKELVSVDIPIQLLVVCGNNHILYDDIEKLKKTTTTPIKVYPFIDNMHELMEVSDLLISKSGGMTSSEIIAKRLPIIIVSPVPGQEVRNGEFLVEYGAGLREDKPHNIKKKAVELFNKKETLLKMKKNIDSIKNPDPGPALVSLIENL